jgi:4-amino-4-deoxy-L-arabinose transferase-like glycosyltransferase
MLGVYLALGLGMLAKGFVPVLLAGVPILVCLLRDHGPAGLPRLRLAAGAAVLAAVVLPWHVAVSLRHDGFAWDYVVNQHVLNFFHQKLPRDSAGDTLAFYWGAFLARSAPWALLAPLAIGEGARGLRRETDETARHTGTLLVWAATPLVLFTFTASRLEHYALPALPPTALLAARGWQRLAAGDVSRGAWAFVGAAGAAFLVAGLVLMGAGPALVGRTYWIAQAPALPALARPCGAGVAAAGVALVWAEPMFSWKPVAELIRARTPAGTEIVFEAPEEYQLVGGLAFYAGRRITLIEPPGWVPPTYLDGQLGGMFTERAQIEARWRDDAPMVLVTDPQRRRESPAGLAPEPAVVLGRCGDRWVLANPAAAPGS